MGPAIAFFVVQTYIIGIQTYYGFRPPDVGTALQNDHDPSRIASLKIGLVTAILINGGCTLVYLFMLYFFYREITPETELPHFSRYAQQSYMAHLQQTNSQSAHHQHAHNLNLENVSAVSYHPGGGANTHHVNTLPTSIGGAPLSTPLPLPPLSAGGAAMGSLTNLPPGAGSRNSIPMSVNPHFPNVGPHFNLAQLSSLPYDQQQQVLKLHLIQQQQQQQQPSHPHSKQRHHPQVAGVDPHVMMQDPQQQQSVGQQFQPPYVHVKTPKF